MTRRRLVAHLAPGAAAWAYVAWILAAYSSEESGHCLLKALWAVQLAVVAFGVFGGVWAFRLPTRALRIGVSAGSLFGAFLLLQAVGLVLFMP